MPPLPWELRQELESTYGLPAYDPRMLDRIFRTPNAPDPLGQVTDHRQGAMAVLIGIAARESAKSGQPIRIGDLTSLAPRTDPRTARSEATERA